jgi:hypothetical protein
MNEWTEGRRVGVRRGQGLNWGKWEVERKGVREEEW